MKSRIDNQLINEKGNILIICVVIIMILTSLGIYGLNSTMTELSISGSDKRENTNFQNAETGLRFAMAYFKLIYQNDDNNGNPIYSSNATGTGIGGNFSINGGQLTFTALPSNPIIVALRDMPLGQGGVMFTYVDNTNTPIARIEIRDICLNPTNIGSLSAFANSVPVALHLTDPPPGSDPGTFDGRCYCITSTALDADGNATATIIQSGVNHPEEKIRVAPYRGL